MSCPNRVSVFYAKGYGFSEVSLRCRSTGPNGELVMCSSCLNRETERYPQGWREVPGDLCRHGTYIGDAYGPDYMCGACESGDD